LKKERVMAFKVTEARIDLISGMAVVEHYSAISLQAFGIRGAGERSRDR